MPRVPAGDSPTPYRLRKRRTHPTGHAGASGGMVALSKRTGIPPITLEISMLRLLVVLPFLILAACDMPPPCQTAACAQRDATDAYRNAMLLQTGAELLKASQPQQTNVYVYRAY